MNILYKFFPLLLQGFVMTCALWLSAAVISISCGFVWGIVRCNYLRIPYVSYTLDIVTFILRAVPFYVQLLMVYFVLPGLIGVHVSAFAAAIISLGFCSAAYVSQMVRGAINVINKGQWEAAQVLGYSKNETVRYIIIPQTIRALLPTLVGECDQLIKSTAIISAIGVLELTGVARNIIAQEMNPLTMYTTIAVIYVCISALITVSAAWLEKRNQI